MFSIVFYCPLSSDSASAVFDSQYLLSNDFYVPYPSLDVWHWPEGTSDFVSRTYSLLQDDRPYPDLRSFDFGASGEYLSNSLKFTNFYPFSARDQQAYHGWGGSLSQDSLAVTYIYTPFVFENVTELHIAFAILQRHGQITSDCNWQYTITYPDGESDTLSTDFSNVAGVLLYVKNDGNNYAYVHVDLEFPYPVTVTFNRIKLTGNWNDQYLTACFSAPYVVYGDPVTPVVTTVPSSQPVITSTTYYIPPVPDYPNEDDDDDDDLPWLLSLIVKSLQNLGGVIVDGIKGLFVPSEEDFSQFYTKTSNLVNSSFGVLSLADGIGSAMVTGALDSVQDLEEIDSIEVKQFSVPLPIYRTSVNGQPVYENVDFDLIPEDVEVPLNPAEGTDLDILWDSLKIIIDIIATIAFISMLRRRFEREILGGAPE